VLGELVFYVLEGGLGDRGLVLGQIVAVAAALTLTSLDLRAARTSDLAAAEVLLAVVFGCTEALIVARAQLFSLALFPLLVLLLRAEARGATRKIWFLVPLIALWSNLHGSVLVGVGVAGAYLLFHRLRREPVAAVLVLLASLAALCATPALYRTPEYYLGVLGNEAAQRGVGLWAPLSLSSPLDVVFILAATLVAVAAVRGRPAAWEVVALAGLAALTLQAGRNGVWFVLFAAVPAAVGLRTGVATRLTFSRKAVLAGASTATVLLALGLAREPMPTGAGDALRLKAAALARGTPILADAIPAEQLALDDQQIVIGNPIDAFSNEDQKAYLDWLEGVPAGRALLAESKVVLVLLGSPPQRRLAVASDFREVARDARAVLYARV
jgi:hypothetical protein